MRTFQYLKPTSLAEVLAILAEHQEKAKIIAGGTDLMIQWKKKLLTVEYLVSLRNVPELNFLSYDGDLRIGSAVTHRTLELSSEIRSHFPIIFDALENLGSVQVRNSGTIGGNICNAAPSADTAPPLLALEAVGKIVSTKGERNVPMEAFFKGPGRTVLERGEVLKELVISKPDENTGMAYWKHTRRKAMDLPILGVAILLTFEEDLTTCAKARVALGVAAPTPMRAVEAETFLQGKPVTEKTLEEAGSIASQEAKPRTTIRGSERYRREMIRVLVKRTGLLCLERASGVNS